MTLSLSVLLGVLVILLLMKFELKKGSAIVCILFGITIANTEVANWVLDFVNMLAGLVGQAKF